MPTATAGPGAPPADLTLPGSWPQAPDEGVWLPAGQPVTGQAAMARTFVLPDPQRPYARVDLVWINSNLARLHFAAGTQNRTLDSGSPGAGEVPLAVQPSLLAAFNGGFQRLANQYGSAGFRVAGQWFTLPTPAMATVAIAPSGRVTLGAWGSEIPTTPLPTDLRQNLPLILDHGRISPQIDDGAAWGTTVNNTVRVWRSGLGQMADGALVYAAGTPLTARGLAEVLQAAGAQQAMELDINSYWVTFNFFSATGPPAAPVRGEKLMPAMTRSATRYLTPDTRDFFYLTAVG
ncbi:MAG TPA: phosphodiester glycosidase family protein [Chloroflexota bacterium]